MASDSSEKKKKKPPFVLRDLSKRNVRKLPVPAPPKGKMGGKRAGRAGLANVDRRKDVGKK
jgi:hypothetical protein